MKRLTAWISHWRRGRMLDAETRRALKRQAEYQRWKQDRDRKLVWVHMQNTRRSALS